MRQEYMQCMRRSSLYFLFSFFNWFVLFCDEREGNSLDRSLLYLITSRMRQLLITSLSLVPYNFKINAINKSKIQFQA